MEQSFILTLEDLVLEAKKQGYDVSHRQLREYIQLGLLPRPSKGGGEGNRLYYSTDTADVARKTLFATEEARRVGLGPRALLAARKDPVHFQRVVQTAVNCYSDMR